ncbi:hypothetical protein E1B28_006574 [Marasmius oreades]|uniref:Uncharacterized protein n=1 Tax=Marasmius oreades TaxID=181124 RepID=A0A9P7UVU9_9AGAR|nr:uncharacterized protein E1B28_006574 [Marasmius oreades]KAG7095885.1 hypothetical protein E1B28_006574 [Marasmius oreades]
MLSLYMGIFAFAILVIASPIEPLSRLDNLSLRDPLPYEPRLGLSKPLLLSHSQVLGLTLSTPQTYRVTDPPKGFELFAQTECSVKHFLPGPTDLNVKECCKDVGCAEVASSKVVRLRCKDLDLSKFGRTGRQQFCMREGYQV